MLECLFTAAPIQVNNNDNNINNVKWARMHVGIFINQEIKKLLEEINAQCHLLKMALLFSSTKKKKNVEIDRTWLSRTVLLKLVLLLAFLSQLRLFNQANDLTSTSIVDSLDEGANNSPRINAINNKKNEKYRNCPFRDSSIVESIYVYPSPGDADWEGDILSNYTRIKNQSIIEDYPWIANDLYCKAAGIGPYDITSQMVQYNTELLVRDILTHPDSCLRTYDPEKATLFYVPYLPAAEYHNGTVYPDSPQSS